MLERRESLRSIAKRLEKSTSSISREVKRNRYKQSKKNLMISCTKHSTCQITHVCGDSDCRRYCVRCIEVCDSDRCPEYNPDLCYYHSHAPFVCNGCEMERRHLCRQECYYYDAKLAQSTYEKTLSDSRCGVSLTARNIDLPRKMHFKKRYSHDHNARSMQSFCEGRTYSDYKDFNRILVLTVICLCQANYY